MIREGQEKRFATNATVDLKACNVDVGYCSICDDMNWLLQLVTEVDKAVEAFITAKILEAYPDHMLYVNVEHMGGHWSLDSIGEETYAGQKITNKATWIVEWVP
jgi:hypothetical protein